MRTGVVCVDDVRAPRLQPLDDPAGRPQVPVAGSADRGYCQSRGPRPSEQGRIRGGDDERFVTCVSLGSREQVHLALAATPGLSQVDVQYPQ